MVTKGELNLKTFDISPNFSLLASLNVILFYTYVLYTRDSAVIHGREFKHTKLKGGTNFYLQKEESIILIHTLDIYLMYHNIVCNTLYIFKW